MKKNGIAEMKEHAANFTGNTPERGNHNMAHNLQRCQN
jgi:hypothetical protein